MRLRPALAAVPKAGPGQSPDLRHFRMWQALDPGGPYQARLGSCRPSVLRRAQCTGTMPLVSLAQEPCGTAGGPGGPDESHHPLGSRFRALDELIRKRRRRYEASSPSEDYLTVLAGQRQWIATTNFAGCPGRPPDSFANSAVLTTSAKVPDALGWPIDPCFPVQIDSKAEQFEQVVACADQRPFAVHLLQSPQQELPESPALLDLAEYRLHSLHPQSVALPTPPGL